MRDTLNAILAFIGSASLTDAEFNALTLESTEDAREVYEALSQVLSARESVSTMIDRLTAYFKAKGYDFTPAQGKSNIFLGGPLCK